MNKAIREAALAASYEHFHKNRVNFQARVAQDKQFSFQEGAIFICDNYAVIDKALLGEIVAVYEAWNNAVEVNGGSVTISNFGRFDKLMQKNLSKLKAAQEAE